MRNDARSKRRNKAGGSFVTKAALRALETRLDPNIKALPTIGQPPPALGPADFWIRRRIQIVNVVAINVASSITLGDCVKQLTSVTSTMLMRVRSVSIYGPLGGAITCDLSSTTLCDSVSSTNSITATDYGSSVRPPGIKYIVPQVSAIVNSVSSASALTVASAKWNTSSNNASTAGLFFVVELEYQMP